MSGQCIACCVSKGDRHTGFLLCPLFCFQSPLQFLSFYFVSLIHPHDLPFFLDLNGKNFPLSSDETALLMQRQRGLIELCCAITENTTQRLVADSCCACVSTCVKVSLLLHRHLSQPHRYQRFRPVHFIWWRLRGRLCITSHMCTCFCARWFADAHLFCVCSSKLFTSKTPRLSSFFFALPGGVCLLPPCITLHMCNIFSSYTRWL